MERRAVYMGHTLQEPKTSAPNLIAGNLLPYQGSFDMAAANHLLRRANFGVGHAQLLQAVDDGLIPTIDKIFSILPITELPVNYSYALDLNAPIGTTWVDKPYTPGQQVVDGNARMSSLISWTIGNCMDFSHLSIREKMVLFWHNHFPVADINDPKFLYTYVTTLRENALGNFRDFTKAMVVDPAMLRYLNGNKNEASSPNENFARELLELFTVGKGDLVGPGDYTNYKEEDIKEMARVLTGWKDRGWYAFDDTQPHGEFVAGKHDFETKKLSNRFNNAIIPGTGENEYLELIDIIFQQPVVANFICTKLYRWFVKSKITEEEESNIIEPLAAMLINSDYEIMPVLKTLLASEHFFNECNRGAQIKNPMDFMGSMLRGSSFQYVEELKGRYEQSVLINFGAALIEMRYFDPPSVAGWKAYYQEPLLDRSWLNSVTMSFRIQIGTVLMVNGIQLFELELVKPDPLQLVDTLENPRFVNEVISQLSELFFTQPLSIEQKDYIKVALLGDLEDIEWESEYILYTDNPDDENLAISLRSRLDKMFARMFSMAEFQLM